MTTIDIPMISDTTWNGGALDTNYDANVYLRIGKDSNTGGAIWRGWIKPDFSSIPAGSTFNSAILKPTPVYDASDNTRTMRAHRCLRDVVSNQATWQIWKTANSWGTVGCSNSSTDYDGAVEMGNMSVSATQTLNVQMSMTLVHAELQKLFDGTYTNNGIALFMDTQVNDCMMFASQEYETTAYRPIITIDYTAPAVSSGFFSLF